MNDLNPATASAGDLTGAIRDRTLGSRELLEFYLRRIERINPVINAVVTLDERAAGWAAAADTALARGEVWGPLHGLPMTVKDAIETAGLLTTGGANEYAEHVPATDADAVARLRAAGAIVFGKTNMPAHAADAQTYNALFGCTNNPWDTGRAVGGSSGGSAAAVAAGLTALELGSDLGGSIRNPAGYCGVYGLRPSHGLIPTRGHVPGPPGMLSELPLGTVGPIARSAADLALELDVLAGPDAAHAVAWRLELPPPRAGSLRDYRIAAWLDDEFCPVDSEVLKVLGAAVDAARDAGARIDEDDRPCSLRDAERLVQRLIWSGVSPAYPEAEFARLRAVAERTDEGDSRVVRHAGNITATAREVGIAQEMKARTAAACAEFFTRHDVLVCPITPTAAIPHDHNPDVDARRILVNGQFRPYGDQIPWASLAGLCGLPAVVVPVGRTSAGLPVGLQVIGPRLEDHTAVDVAGRLGRLFGGFTAPPGLPG